MPLPNGMPTAREISFEDWDHFVLLLAIKTFYEKKSKRKLRLADASAIFTAHDYAEKENAIGVIMIRDEEKKP